MDGLPTYLAGSDGLAAQMPLEGFGRRILRRDVISTPSYEDVCPCHFTSERCDKIQVPIIHKKLGRHAESVA